MAWDGRCGLENQSCDGSLHWILTPGGQGSVSDAGLTVTSTDPDGDERTETAAGSLSGGGAWHFHTGAPSSVQRAEAHFDGRSGSNTLVTIS